MFVRKKLLYWLVLGFAAGVVVGELTVSLSTIIIFLTTAFVLSGFFAVFNKKSVSVGIILVFVVFTLGFARSEWSITQTNKPTQLDGLVNEKISFVGTVTEEQERREFNTRLQVRVDEIELIMESATERAESAGEILEKINKNLKVLVTTTSPKDFRYGDVVSVKGSLVLPENFYTETGREFDYVGYLQANKIKFLVKNASVQIVGRDPPSKVLSGLYATKRAFVSALARMLPEPQSSLAAGILIDGKQSINGELQEKFRKTGLVHIVVLSGYNVSIVAEAITKAFMFLPRLAGMFSAIIGIVAFAMITGASSTVIRASIMAIIVILSRMSLRNYDPARGLFIASFLMLVHNPAILIHSPSFQLSFLATFSVVKVVPLFRKWGSLISERFGLRDLVVSNIVVQIFLFPILSWMTGFFSAVSLPVNLLVLPLIPFTMLMNFLTGMLGLVPLPIFYFLALPFAFVSQTVLSYELTVVNIFAQMSFAEIPFSGFSSGVVIGFYVVVILSLLIFEGRDIKKVDDL